MAGSCSTGVGSSKVDGKQYGDWQTIQGLAAEQQLAASTGDGSSTVISRKFMGWNQNSGSLGDGSSTVVGTFGRKYRGWKQYSD